MANISMLRMRVEQLIKASIADPEQRQNALYLLGLIFIDFPEESLVEELKKRGQVR